MASGSENGRQSPPAGALREGDGNFDLRALRMGLLDSWVTALPCENQSLENERWIWGDGNRKARGDDWRVQWKALEKVVDDHLKALDDHRKVTNHYRKMLNEHQEMVEKIMDNRMILEKVQDDLEGY